MLAALDRTSHGRFSITQDFLASLLGCTRSTVNLILGELEDVNAISTHRGTIEVIDRVGLEKMTCECYRIIRETYEDLKGRAAKVTSEARQR